MKSWFILCLMASFLVLSSSCGENVTPAKQAEIDKAKIEEYVAAEGLTGSFTTSGLYVVIETLGTGTAYPTSSSTLEIIYTGYLLDGSVFDSSGGFPASLPLNQLISGWQEGLKLYKKGGKGKLVIPSALAYGTQSRTGIPANSVLVFDIELLDF